MGNYLFFGDFLKKSILVFLSILTSIHANKILTTIAPYQFIIESIFPSANVECIDTGSSDHHHGCEIDTKMILKIPDFDCWVLSGDHLENALMDSLKESLPSIKIIKIDSNNECFHKWIGLTSLLEEIDGISSKLIDIFKDHSEEISINTEKFKTQIQNIKKEFSNLSEEKIIIISSHECLDSLSKDFNIKEIALSECEEDISLKNILSILDKNTEKKLVLVVDNHMRNLCSQISEKINSKLIDITICNKNIIDTITKILSGIEDVINE